MPGGNEADKRVREPAIGTAGADASEATGQMPVGRRGYKEALDGEVESSAGRTEETGVRSPGGGQGKD